MELTLLAKPSKIHGMTGTGPGLGDQQAVHQQPPWFPFETPESSVRRWQLWRNLIPSERELHFSRFPGAGSHCILTSITSRLECGNVYAPSEQQVCYTLRRGCSYAVALYPMPGDVSAFLRLSATLNLSAIAIYRMPHLPHICSALRFGHIYQYSLRFEYITCRCISFAIIVFYMSEIYSPILTLSSTMPSVLHILRWSITSFRCLFLLICIRIVTMLALIPVDITGSEVKPMTPSVLHILRWSIIGLQCLFLLILIRIITIFAPIPVDITGSQIKPLEFSRRLSSLAGGEDGIAHVAFITFIFVISAAPWHPEMNFAIHAIDVYQDVWVSASGFRLLKRHFRGQIIKKNSISKKYICPGGMAPSEWTRSVIAVRDTLVADYSAPGVNSTHHVPYRPLITVSPFLLVLLVSYCKRSLWGCGQLWPYVGMGSLGTRLHRDCNAMGDAAKYLLAFLLPAPKMQFSLQKYTGLRRVTLQKSLLAFLLPARKMQFSLY